METCLWMLKTFRHTAFLWSRRRTHVSKHHQGGHLGMFLVSFNWKSNPLNFVGFVKDIKNFSQVMAHSPVNFLHTLKPEWQHLDQFSSNFIGKSSSLLSRLGQWMKCASTLARWQKRKPAVSCAILVWSHLIVQSSLLLQLMAIFSLHLLYSR